MEEEPFKVSSDPRSLGQASGHDVLPSGQTQAPPPQPHLSMQLFGVSWSLDQRQKLPGDGGKPIPLSNEDSSKLDQHTVLELQPPSSSAPGIRLVGVDSESETQNEHFSESLSSTWENSGFRLYLAEQQKKLPLPLKELMETEALEILTKALKSYRSKIGENHFLTKELQQSIEELQRRRRLLWRSQ